LVLVIWLGATGQQLSAQTQDLTGQIDPDLDDSALLQWDNYPNLAGKSLFIWLAELHNADPTVRATAARNLAATPAPLHIIVVPFLLGALEDKVMRVWFTAAESLRWIGQPAVKPMIAKLKHKDAKVRLLAVVAIRLAYQTQEEDVPQLAVGPLLGALRDPSPKVRAAAARALGLCDQWAHQTLPYLLVSLYDRDANVREAAVGSLGWQALRPDIVVPRLIYLLCDPVKSVRQAAADALSRFGPNAAPAVPALIKAEIQGKANTVWTLGSIGPRAAPAVPLLVQRLRVYSKDGWWFESVGYLNALGKIGPSSKPALPWIEKAMQAEPAEIRVRAAAALWQIEPKRGSQALNAMIAALQKEGWKVQPLVQREIRDKGWAVHVLVKPHLVAPPSSGFGGFGNLQLDWPAFNPFDPKEDQGAQRRLR
jgi:HEAT repeat protein